MRIGSICNIVIGIPVFIILSSSNSIISFIIAQIILTIFHIIFCVPIPKMICSFFNSNIRNTHVSFGYGLSISITAAFMPYINNLSYKYFSIYGLALNLLVFIVLGFLSTLKFKSNE